MKINVAAAADARLAAERTKVDCERQAANRVRELRHVIDLAERANRSLRERTVQLEGFLTHVPFEVRYDAQLALDQARRDQSHHSEHVLTLGDTESPLKKIELSQ